MADPVLRKESQFRYEESGARHLLAAARWARRLGLLTIQCNTITKTVRVTLNGAAPALFERIRREAASAPRGARDATSWSILVDALDQHGPGTEWNETSLAARANRDTVLTNLLVDLFTACALRSWIRSVPGGELASRDLPTAVSPGELCASVVEVSRQHGLIDEEFFRCLEAVRPRRAADIRVVMRLWLQSPERQH